MLVAKQRRRSWSSDRLPAVGSSKPLSFADVLGGWMYEYQRKTGKAINLSVIADGIGVSPSAVSKWANGTQRPEREYADALYRFFSQKIDGDPIVEDLSLDYVYHVCGQPCWSLFIERVHTIHGSEHWENGGYILNSLAKIYENYGRKPRWAASTSRWKQEAESLLIKRWRDDDIHTTSGKVAILIFLWCMSLGIPMDTPPESLAPFLE